jgi:DNA-directed RNA polymerase specialized sigma24 family protein
MASNLPMTRLVEIAAPPELLALARRGDDCARAQLYASLAPAVFGLIRRLVNGRAQAEDLFQETMMTFYERLDSYRGEAPLGAWLRQIAISKCLMYLRSPWHRARLEVGRDELDGHASTPPPECLDVERALGSLSSTARAVVWLYEVEGYSHEEIAHAFGRTVSFSKSQLARAHRRLRAWFEPQAERQPCTPN